MSSPDLHQRACELFTAVRAMTPKQRAQALEDAHAQDPEVAREARSLLEHDDLDLTAQANPSQDALPARIGPYRILSRIGQGGSGQVFLAEQEQPLRRRVALKLVPLAAFSPEQAARFAVERAALEATDHPHVARVLDAGQTSEGWPFLVMNFVDGEPITSFCRRRGLPFADRVRLLMQVGDAVQHVHQRGVIHRDLKPANVLVAQENGRSVPQVVDFGIAKAVGGAFAFQSPPTLGLPIGTPAYMAPEQTRQGSVDTRADVYGLGAILYELVAGRPPLEISPDPLQGLEQVREEIPAPCSRARRAALASGERNSTPAAVARGFEHDLDLILAKALEKDPAHRYASVDRFVEDLRRLLAVEPIAARPPQWRYRAERFVRRHRVSVAAGVLVLLALGVGTLALGLGLAESRRQHARATEQYAAQVEINRFLTDDVLGQAGPELGGPDLTARELLDSASKRIEHRLAGLPLAQAAVHHALGEAYGQLAAFDEATAHLERAIELRSAVCGPDAPDTVHSEIAAGSLLARSQHYQAAQSALVLALSRARRILGPDDPALYTALNDLGVVLTSLGSETQAMDLLTEALAGRERLLAQDDPQRLATLNNLALALDALGRPEEALQRLQQALLVARSFPDPPRMAILGFENNIGATLQDLERDAQAAPHLENAAKLARELLGAAHPSTLLIEGNLASVAADLGNIPLALETFERVIEGQTASLGAHAADTLTARLGYWNTMLKAQRFDEASAGLAQVLEDIGSALGPQTALALQAQLSLARALQGQGQIEPALVHARTAHEHMTALYGPEHARVRSARELIETLGRTRGDASPGPR